MVYLFRLLPLLLLCLLACKKENQVDQYSLVVNNGTGGGNFTAESIIHITADPAPEEEIFDQWIGDIGSVSDFKASVTTLKMPSQNIEITATYAPQNFGEPAAIIIDKNSTYQTIDGFGFFGARDVWWGSADPSHFHSEPWLDKVIGDLGITMWRNEYYPHNPPRENNTPNQDAHWDKQKPMVQALKAKADEYDTDLRVILTAWTPPGAFKWNAWGYE